MAVGLAGQWSFIIFGSGCGAGVGLGGEPAHLPRQGFSGGTHWGPVGSPPRPQTLGPDRSSGQGRFPRTARPVAAVHELLVSQGQRGPSQTPGSAPRPLPPSRAHWLPALCVSLWATPRPWRTLAASPSSRLGWATREGVGVTPDCAAQPCPETGAPRAPHYVARRRRTCFFPSGLQRPGGAGPVTSDLHTGCLVVGAGVAVEA